MKDKVVFAPTSTDGTGIHINTDEWNLDLLRSDPVLILHRRDIQQVIEFHHPIHRFSLSTPRALPRVRDR